MYIKKDSSILPCCLSTALGWTLDGAILRVWIPKLDWFSHGHLVCRHCDLSNFRMYVGCNKIKKDIYLNVEIYINIYTPVGFTTGRVHRMFPSLVNPSYPHLFPVVLWRECPSTFWLLIIWSSLCVFACFIKAPCDAHPIARFISRFSTSLFALVQCNWSSKTITSHRMLTFY